jgi:hypothetical protein
VTIAGRRLATGEVVGDDVIKLADYSPAAAGSSSSSSAGQQEGAAFTGGGGGGGGGGGMLGGASPKHTGKLLSSRCRAGSVHLV